MAESGTPQSVIPARGWSVKTVLAAAGGMLLALLAIGTVLTTARANHRQQTLVNCGATVVQQTVAALKTRDQAQIDLGNATQIIIVARQQAYHAMYDEIRHANSSPIILDNAIKVYDDAIITYGRAVANTNLAVAHAPLPNAQCFAARKTVADPQCAACQ